MSYLQTPKISGPEVTGREETHRHFGYINSVYVMEGENKRKVFFKFHIIKKSGIFSLT